MSTFYVYIGRVTIKHTWDNQEMMKQDHVMANKCALLDQEFVNERFEWMNEWINEWMNEMNEQQNESEWGKA